MDSSYSTMMGTASITWLITSGGVRTAAMTKAATIAYFRLLASPSTVTRPALASSRIATGSSKDRPKAKTSRITRPRYSEMRGSTSIDSVSAPPPIWNDRKNSQASGITR